MIDEVSGYYLGLMSGTSMDGVDAAIVEVKEEGKINVSLQNARTFSYSPPLKRKLNKFINKEVISLKELIYLNSAIGEEFARAANMLLQESGMNRKIIKAIGSHGQTIAHYPTKTNYAGYKVHGTLQLGDPSIIALRTGITTIYGFRDMDMACGGEGAPLVPLVDFLLFSNDQLNRVILNIGGISNITYIKANAKIEEVYGFDTGPGNILLDGLMCHLSNNKLHFDDGGKFATAGKVDNQLLSIMLEHPFISKKPPKSTGREQFGRKFMRKILYEGKRRKLTNFDLLATVGEFTVRSIIINLKRFIGLENIDEIIASGGGVKNEFLMKRLKKSAYPIKVSISDDYGIPVDFKEAIAFAILAFLSLKGIPANLPRVTGADRAVRLGKVVLL